MITEFISSLLFGRNGGLTAAELKSMSERKRFSDYLPYIAYDEETRCYINQDNTIGFIWECSPLCFAGEKTINTLTGIFRAGLPVGSVVQFSLLADKHIEPYVESYRRSKVRQNPLIRKSTDELCSFMYRGMDGLTAVSGIPVRIFRLFVSVKVPLPEKGDSSFNRNDTYLNIEESLSGAGLYPSSLKPVMLIELLRRIFNDRPFTGAPLSYDETIPIRKQVILSDTVISKSQDRINVGGKIFRCITPKSFPKDVDPLMANELFGGIWGVRSDGDQIKTPFLYTINMIVEKLKTKLHFKCDMVLRQQAVGSFAPSLMRKKDEFMWAVDQLDKGVDFVRIIPIVWAWGDSDEQISESISRIKRIWEAHGCVMQEDKGILPILFISALPFGLYNTGKNVEDIDRDFIVPPDTAMTIAPIQADFAGGGEPILLYTGRKGGMISLDVFSPKVNNFNCLIMASTGSGKSFKVNYFAFNHFARGGLVRIIDIGGSYKKMTKMLDAIYLDFDESSKICINPFSSIRETEKDDDIPVVATIVLQMIYSSTDVIPQEIAETSSTLVKNAVAWAWEQEKGNADIDLVYRYLLEFPRMAAGFSDGNFSGSSALDNFKTLAHTMAFNLRDFTSEGVYGKWFNGVSNFDISRDEFVVLELDKLSQQPELFKVVTMQVVNAVTQDLYLSNREKPRMVIFDEAWQLKKNHHLKNVIESGYRRARKYKGSFTIVTQSPLDLRQFGDIGDVINANAAFKFYLESSDFDKARQEKIIDCDDFILDYMKTVKTVKPKYSEVFMDTPFGKGVARLVVDPFSYYVYTSAPEEISEIESLVNGGMSYDRAIEEMVRKYRS